MKRADIIPGERYITQRSRHPGNEEGTVTVLYFFRPWSPRRPPTAPPHKEMVLVEPVGMPYRRHALLFSQLKERSR